MLDLKFDLKLKMFPDGDRTIIAIEGCPYNDVKDILGKMLHGLLEMPAIEADKIESPEEECPQVNDEYEEVKPIAPEDQKPQEPPKEDITTMDTPTFKFGEYIGLTPGEILKDQNNSAFNWCCENIDDFDSDLANLTYEELEKFLRERFKDTDKKAYPNKLSPAQVDKFFIIHQNAFPGPFKKQISRAYGFEEWEEFVKNGLEENKRKAIAIIIDYLQS